MTREEEKKYDTVVEYSVATEAELNLVKCIIPDSWTEIIDDIIYARNGQRKKGHIWKIKKFLINE